MKNGKEKGEFALGSALNLLAGLWLMFGHYSIAFPNNFAVTGNLIFGALIVVLSLISLFLHTSLRVSALVGLAGAWFIISPFVLLRGFDSEIAFWNNTSFGAIVVFLAVFNIITSKKILEHYKLRARHRNLRSS